MNERIKELVLKARGQATSDTKDGGKCFDLDLFHKKFAELIVLECNYLIQQQVSLKYKDGWEQCGISDEWAGGHYAASILSRTLIKQHFGVKE